MQRLFRVLMVGTVVMAIAAALTAGGSSPVTAGEPIVCVTATPPTGATDTPTNTAVIPTDTPTNTPTNTPIPPTDTVTNTPTNTATATATNTPLAQPDFVAGMVQAMGQLASIRQPGVSGPNAAFGVLPTCTPTPTSTSTDTPTNTPTDTPTTAPTDTAIATTEASVTATLGGATEVPGTETPVVQLPNTGSGTSSTNPFAILALLLMAACGVVWAIGRQARKA